MENNNSNTGNKLANVQGFTMFQRPPKIGVKLYGDPVKLKFNCAGKGQMTDAQDNYISNTMDMIILNSKETHAQLFKYEPQIWREIIFVNSDDAVCVTLIKGESLTQYKNCIQSILLKGFAIAECTITAKFVGRTNKNNQSYSVIEFSWKESPADKTQMIVDFVTKNPQIMGYSYLEELMIHTSRVDTETGEEVINAEIVEHGNMAVKTDGFGEQYKD